MLVESQQNMLNEALSVQAQLDNILDNHDINESKTHDMFHKLLERNAQLIETIEKEGGEVKEALYEHLNA